MVESDTNADMPVIFLMGPTASGKTALAVEIVKNLPVDIISVDSAMVYRGLDIGTAKPSPAVLKIAPHKLIDICEPTESYSAGDFCRDARLAINEIQNRGRIPLLVGGTGLYFRSLEKGISRLPRADPEIRQMLEDEARESGWEKLHERLARVDPEAAARIHRNDPQRVQRALEVYMLTGQSISWFHNEGRSQVLQCPPVKLIVAPAVRDRLHHEIESRFIKMLNAGLVAEVEAFYGRGDLSLSSPAMRLVGYRQVWSYLEGTVSYNDMINKAIIATRQLAKRQMTWLRSEQNASWFDAEKPQLSHFLLDFLRDKVIKQAGIII